MRRGINRSVEVVGANVPLSDLPNWIEILKSSGVTSPDFMIRQFVSNIVAFRKDGLNEDSCFKKVISEIENGLNKRLEEEDKLGLKRAVHDIYTR